MKVATYNVNGINGRMPVLLRWLAEAQPDVVCLQELKAPQEKFPEKPIRDLGYDAIWQRQKSWNGVAILSRIGQFARHVVVFPATLMTATAATSRPPSTGS